MKENKEAFLEKKINLYAFLINELESTRKNYKQRKGLENFQILYKKYVVEYKELLIVQQSA